MSQRLAGSIAAVLIAVVVTSCGGSRPVAEPGPATATPTPTATPTTATTPSPSAPRSKPAASIAGLPAQQIVKKAGAAAKAAAGVRARGSLAMEDGTPLTIDVSLTRIGGSGTITIDGAGLKVLVIGRTAYVRPSDAYWRMTTKPTSEANRFIKLTRGRWIKAALADVGFGQMASFASKADFFDALFDQAVAVRKTGTRTIGGILCVGLGEPGQGTAWVDAVNARLIQLDQPGPSGSIAFSEYDQVKAPKAPPKSQVIDGKRLGL